jgi:DNA-binding transcriptional regulator LsrR (DeoR family)
VRSSPGNWLSQPSGSFDHVRLVTKVARLYHEQKLRQPEIASRLHISQPRVSRLLRQAVEMGIVQTTVVAPRSIFSDLEQAIEDRYGLGEAVVVDTGDAGDERGLLPALGAAAGQYLHTTLLGGDTIGISSWSSTLLATVDAMKPKPVPVADQVVQVLGGVGAAEAQVQASRLTAGLARLTGAVPVFLPAPGLVASAATRDALSEDPSVAGVLDLYRSLSVMLVGIGSLEPSELLVQSGNAIAPEDQDTLRRAGAVGDICLRFFDAAGLPVVTGLNDRIVGISAHDLRAVPRTIAVAGGDRKIGAVRAALLGRWLNVLITDLRTAQALAD